MGITTLTEKDEHAQTGVIRGLEYGVTLEEITNAFTTFANEGVLIMHTSLRRIENANGDIIYNHKPEPRIVSLRRQHIS